MLSGEEKIFFYHQLLSIVRANLPITSAASVMDQSLLSGNLSELTKQMTLSLEQGTPLSDYMAGKPDTFSAYERNIVKAGEDNSAMAGSFEWLVELFSRENERARKVRLQNWYLMFSLGIVILVCLILLFLVVPLLEEVFGSMGGRFPV